MTKTKNQLFLSFFSIVVLSLIFRISHLDVVEFKKDEALNLLLASRPIFSHPFVSGGTISSIGILNPPFFNYLLFPITLFTLDPRIISGIIGIINSFAIGCLFLLLKRYCNFKVAVIATILMAFSPWAVIFSRKIWMQDLLLPFFVLLLYSFYKILDGKQYYWLHFTITTFFLIQLHLGSIFYLTVLWIFLILKRVKLSLKYISIGIVIGLIPLIPYLLYETKNSCPDCKIILTTSERVSTKYQLNIFLRPLQLLGQGNFQFVLGKDMITFATQYPIIYQLRKILYLQYFLLPFGVIIFWKMYPKFRILIYSTVLLPFVYFVLKLEPFIHYYIIVIPLLFLFSATGINYFLSSQSKFYRIMSYILLTSIIFSSIFFDITFFQLIEKEKGLDGDYGPSFSTTDRLVKNKLSLYKNTMDYKEMIISEYVPNDMFYGYQPTAKMLYDRQTTEHSLISLEKQLLVIPQDSRIQKELLAFYTKSVPSKKVLRTIREKSKKSPEYYDIYEKAYYYYLSDKLLSSYNDESLGIEFEYPKHWKVEVQNKTIFVKKDGFVIEIKTTALPPNPPIELSNFNKKNVSKEADILGSKIKKVTCITDMKKWCGTYFDSFSYNYNYYSIRYFLNLTIDSILSMDNNYLKDTLKEMDRIVNSIEKI